MMSEIYRHKKIKVVVNGNTMSLEKGIFIDDLLGLLNVESQRYVVVINDQVIPKSAYMTTLLKSGDDCDIMSPISGG